jgi:glycosyltransferase involved in cell wall biosynthesis
MSGSNSKIRAIVAVPSEGVIGGVSVLFAVLKSEMESREHRYQTIGKRADERSSLNVFWRLFSDWWSWFVTIRKYKPEIAHVNPSLKSKSLIRDGAMVLIAKCCGVKSVSFFHGWSEEFERSRIGRWLFRIGIGQSDTIIVLGKCYRQKLLELNYKKQITVIQNPVSQEVIDRFEDKQKDFLQPSKILFLSRVIKAKGVHELLSAFKRLSEERPDIELRIAGDGDERTRLEARTESESIRNVTYLGFVNGDDKNTELENATLLVLPSYTEGIPLSILEGMAVGLPVVTTPVGGIPDFFEDNRMGKLVKVRDINSLYHAIVELVDNPKLSNEIANYNRRFARENFSPACFVSKLQTIYSTTAQS